MNKAISYILSCTLLLIGSYCIYYNFIYSETIVETIHIEGRGWQANNNVIKYYVISKEFGFYEKLYIEKEMYDRTEIGKFNGFIIIGTPYNIEMRKEYTMYWGFPERVWVISKLTRRLP